MSETTHEGGCLCGAIRYCVRAPHPGVAVCHCSMCRRQSGAASVPWISAPVKNIEFTKGYTSIFKSSEKGERGFCKVCGTFLTFAHADWPDDLDVTVGSLDRPEDFAPTHHIWTSTRLHWVPDDGLPAYPETKSKE